MSCYSRSGEERGMKYRDLIEKQTQTAMDFFDQRGDRFEEATDRICAQLVKGHKILVFGNGGSAAQAQHFASELVNKFLRSRRAIPALSFTTDTSSLTSIANDFDFDRVFSRQMEAFGQEGDVAIALSTSGESANVIQALQTARDQKLITIGLTGNGGGTVGSLCDVLLDVPSNETPRVQEVHLLILHLLAQMIEERVG